jgi:hypothetical protein
MLRRRRKIERLFVWLQHFRRLIVRWEHSLDNFLGMVHLGCASCSYGVYEMRSILFLGGIHPDSLLVEGRFVLTALQGWQSSVELIDRKSAGRPPTRIFAHFTSTLSFL